MREKNYIRLYYSKNEAFCQEPNKDCKQILTKPIKKTAAAGILPAAATKIIFYCSQASRALLNALNANMLPIKAVNAKNATNSENVLSPTDE